MVASKRLFRTRLLVVVAFGLTGISAGPVAVQTVVIRAATLGVRVTSSDMSTVDSAARGMAVPEGSRLTGDDPDERVQLECADDVTYTIIGPFDIVVHGKDAQYPAGSKDPKHPGPVCTVDLNSGTAVATTGIGDDSGAEGASAAIIAPGAVAMVSHHTQFGLAVSPQSASGIQSAFVLDGAAVLVRKGSPRDVRAGSSVDPETNRTHAIDDDTYQNLANTYTNLDLSEPSAQGSQGSGFELQQRWVDVLEHSGVPLARVRLAEMQAAAGATQSAIFYYELKRAEDLAKASRNRDFINRVRSLRRKFGNRPRNLTPGPPNPPPFSVTRRKVPRTPAPSR